jgi:hypothetical protein
MLKDRMHMVPPAVIDLGSGAMNEFNPMVRNNYLQRLRATKEYIDEAIVKIDAKRATEKRTGHMV